MGIKIKCFLFDLDDTIIDSKIYKKIYPEIIKLVKSRRKITSIDKIAGSNKLKKNKHGRWDTGELCFKLGLEKDYYTILKRHIKQMPEIDSNVLDLFKLIKKSKAKIGIVSNSRNKTIKLYLVRYRIGNFIDFIISSSDIGAKKNSLSYWKRVIGISQISASESMVIGDHMIDDYITPRKLGFNAYLVRRNGDFTKLIQKFNYK